MSSLEVTTDIQACKEPNNYRDKIQISGLYIKNLYCTILYCWACKIDTCTQHVVTLASRIYVSVHTASLPSEVCGLIRDGSRESQHLRSFLLYRYQYGKILETSVFMNRAADFVWMLLIIGGAMHVSFPFLLFPILEMMFYTETNFFFYNMMLGCTA